MTAAHGVVRAADAPPPPGPAPAAAPVPAPAHGPCAPATRKICVTECVPEYYTTTRTVYRTEKVCENYTAYKCVSVPETRTRTCTVYEKVPVCETRTRTFCVSVPCVEQRTCMEKFWVCKPVTTCHRKCVDKGHYECREVPCKQRHHKKSGCCDPCNPCECCECPKTKTVKVWVPCKVWVEEQSCKMQRVCEYRPVTKCVHTCKKEVRHETYQVTVCKCVPRCKTETYTVCVEKKIPYQATREVCKCVPHQETVRCCRMVQRVVEKEVPVCDTGCQPSCCDGCQPKCRKHHRSRSCCD
jgi:hypothetical protein